MQVASAFSVHLAAYKALVNQARGGTKSQSLHSEVIFALSGDKHIADSYRLFGPNADTRHILVGVFNADDSTISQVRAKVKGDVVPIEDLATLSKDADINRAYKSTEDETASFRFDDIAISRIGSYEFK